MQARALDAPDADLGSRLDSFYAHGLVNARGGRPEAHSEGLSLPRPFHLEGAHRWRCREQARAPVAMPEWRRWWLYQSKNWRQNADPTRQAPASGTSEGAPSPGDGDNAAPEEMAVAYYLSNEGTGPAFNVEHGIEVGGKPYAWENRLWRTMRPGEFIPQLDPNAGQSVPPTALTIGVKKADWNANVVYWTRFENLLGERFEVRKLSRADAPCRLLSPDIAIIIERKLWKQRFDHRGRPPDSHRHPTSGRGSTTRSTKRRFR
jgi:hypothetical protein